MMKKNKKQKQKTKQNRRHLYFRSQVLRECREVSDQKKKKKPKVVAKNGEGY